MKGFTLTLKETRSVHNLMNRQKSNLFLNEINRVSGIRQGVTIFVLSFQLYKNQKGSLTVWALYAYFSDSQNAVFALLVWCM